MTILVTGAKGMIGSQLVKTLIDLDYIVIGVDRTGEEICEGNYYHYKVDLADKVKLRKIVEKHNVDRFIHLAALAHTDGKIDLSWEKYKHINIDCAKNVFDIAGNLPLLFISTVDVYGFYDGKKPVNSETVIHPVSKYGKSKALAEEECKKLLHYSIFRLSPVYTDTIKRDIQKRYYLKYPKIAYRIGKGTAYEVLDLKYAVKKIADWCNQEPKNEIKIIKDEKKMWTPNCIKTEKKEGRAKVVLYFPKWMVKFGYVIIKGILGENEKTYKLNKAIHPMRSE